MGGMWLVAQAVRDNHMIPLPNGNSVHVLVVLPLAGAVCLALFLALIAVLIYMAATGRRREDAD